MILKMLMLILVMPLKSRALSAVVNAVSAPVAILDPNSRDWRHQFCVWHQVGNQRVVIVGLKSWIMSPDSEFDLRQCRNRAGMLVAYVLANPARVRVDGKPAGPTDQQTKLTISNQVVICE